MATKEGHWRGRGLFPATLTDKDGNEEATAVALEGKRAVGVLFSAHWCAPCRAFAPSLARFYNECRKKDEDSLEIVFASSDRSDEAFRSYLGSMPWLAIPYAETSATAKLAGLCKVRGIPSLVIFDGATGELLTSTGRADVSQPGAVGNAVAVVENWLGKKHRDSETTKPAREVPWGIMVGLLAAMALVMYYQYNKQ